MSRFAGNYIVNLAAVKVIDIPEEKSFDVLVYNDETGEFERNFGFLNLIMYGREDIQKVTEEELENYIKQRN
jgi:hypothetical protein